jgi:FSR family fosmidomycin resistance protein-like MFS transporter
VRSHFRLSIRWRGLASLAALFLFIEFLDELVFGTREAAWPLIRSELGLSYAEVGLLLAIPAIVSGLFEPLVGLYGDTRHRRSVILLGGVAFAAGLAIAAVSKSVWPLLFAFGLLYPASGAFVSLSQATLMDASPGEHEHAMARWTFAGSIGVVLGPVVLAAAPAAGLSWRSLFVAWAVLAVGAVAILRYRRSDTPRPSADLEGEPRTFREALDGALIAARRPRTWRWLLLLECSDLMLDVLLGFVALYLVDSTGASAAQAGLAVSAIAVTGLIGDGLIIPLLRRVPGLAWVRVTAIAAVPVFLLFLVVPGFWPKVVALVAVGLLSSGWYAVLQGQLYASLPGQSGAVVSISAVFGLVTALVPLGLGFVAGQFSITAAMAILAIGPVGLALGVPRAGSRCPSPRTGEATE